MAFDVKIQNHGNQFRVSMKGRFDETTELPSMNLTDASVVTFDWTDVTYINSVGIHRWIKYISDVARLTPAKNLRFEGCPVIIVDQMAKIRGFILPQMRINSFVVPFFCEPCAESKTVLYEDGNHYNAKDANPSLSHPRVQCPKCKKPMELDVLSDQYFTFFDILSGQT